jgi:hypothetical protein
MEMTKRLLASWPQKHDDDYRENITTMFLHFPRAIGNECADPWFGVARTLAKKEYPPSTEQVREWCNSKIAEYHKFLRPPPSPFQHQPERPPPSPDDVAKVRARLKEVTDSLTRVWKGKTEEQKRAEADVFVHRDKEHDRRDPIFAQYKREAKASQPAAPSVFDLDPDNWDR